MSHLAQSSKRKLEELETEVKVTGTFYTCATNSFCPGEGEPPTKRAKSTPTLISEDKRMYLTSRCRINVTAVGPHDFGATFVDLQEVLMAGLETKFP
jgi:hypothetical protein